MGVCLSVESRDSQNNKASSLWSCFAVTSERDCDQKALAKVTDTCHSELRDPDSGPLQPQARAEAEIARTAHDRNDQTTKSGQWPAAPIAPQEVDGQEELFSATEAGQRLSLSKKRKRSLSQVFYQQFRTKRPQTAPEQRRPEWRVSLRIYGTRSPFPDFSSLKIRGIDDATDGNDDDDVRSSYTYVNSSSAPSTPEPSSPWPLPNQLVTCPALDDAARQNTQGRASCDRAPDQQLPAEHQPSWDKINPTPEPTRSRHRTPRSRALSDPFRYAKLKRTSMSRSESQNIAEEIRELRILVERNKESRSGIDSASRPGLSDHASNTTIKRSKSKGHIPAIAPSMTVRVRSEVLSDIGSAFSKPFSGSEVEQRSPTGEYVDAVTASSSRRLEPAKRPMKDKKLENTTKAVSMQKLARTSQRDVAEWTALTEAVRSTPQPASPIHRLAGSTVPSAPSSSDSAQAQLNAAAETSRSSVVPVAFSAPDTSTSEVSAVTSTLSSPSASSELASHSEHTAASADPEQQPQQQVDDPTAPTKRKSNLLSEIWQQARETLELFGSKKQANGGSNFTREEQELVGDVKPPAPLKPSMKSRS